MSTGRVLVIEEVVGRSVRDAEALDASPVPRRELARRVLSSFLGQILVDGVYHADPHPENLLVDDSGSIWFVDFGSVGRLDSNALEAVRASSTCWRSSRPARPTCSPRTSAQGRVGLPLGRQ